MGGWISFLPSSRFGAFTRIGSEETQAAHRRGGRKSVHHHDIVVLAIQISNNLRTINLLPSSYPTYSPPHPAVTRHVWKWVNLFSLTPSPFGTNGDYVSLPGLGWAFQCVAWMMSRRGMGREPGDPNGWKPFWNRSRNSWFKGTLQGTNISPKKWHFEDDFPNFPRWDMLIPWRVLGFYVQLAGGNSNFMFI